MKRLAFLSLMLGAAFVAHAAPFQAPTGLSPSDLQHLPQAGSGVVLRSITRLVDVSAVVVDTNGNPVTDLKKGDFEIYDEGKRQNIRLFAPPTPYLPAAKESSQAAVPAVSSPSRVFSNQLEEGTRPSAPMIVLYDEGLAKWEEKGFARDRLIRFLKEQPPEQQIGVYMPIMDGVGIVHEFTRDSSELVKVIQEWNFGPLPHTLQSNFIMAHEDLRGTKTLDQHYCSETPVLEAITASANHVAGIAGRKTLIWFSLGGMSGSGLQNCFNQETEAQRALNKANMALYAIDARGLQSVQPDAAIGLKELGCLKVTGAGCDSGVQVIKNLNKMTQGALDGLEQAHQLMLDLAEKAGGRALIEGNDTLAALRTPFAESHAAYALGFYPESRLDGRYHELSVKVPGRPDLTVRYRRGYVDESIDPKGQLRTALWSPLDATAIPLTAELIPSDDGAYDVKLSIGIAALDLAQDDGRWQGKIHVIFAQKDQNGRQFEYRDDTLQIDLKAMRSSGLAYRQVVKPNPKASLLRVVVRDEAGNLGSVTIPLTEPQTQLIRSKR
jgi:VWFA-related protein